MLALASRSLGTGERCFMHLVLGILRMGCCTLAQRTRRLGITNEMSWHGHCLYRIVGTISPEHDGHVVIMPILCCSICFVMYLAVVLRVRVVGGEVALESM